MSMRQVLALSVRLDPSGSLLSLPISCFGETFFVFVWELPCCVNKLNLNFFGFTGFEQATVIGFPRLTF